MVRKLIDCKRVVFMIALSRLYLPC